MKSSIQSSVLIALIALTASTAVAVDSVPTDVGRARAGEALPPLTDPAAWFDLLVERYRAIESYRDNARVIEVMDRPGRRIQRVERDVTCEVTNGRLHVTTPTGQARDGLGLDVPMRSSPTLEALGLRYALWLAPHMTLKYEDEPLEKFREGTRGGFQATVAEPVTIDDRPMVHLELTSGGEPGGRSADYEAKFDLFINPESMLIERIEGEHRMDDGARHQTTVDIVTAFVEPRSGTAPVAAEDEEVTEDPDAGEPAAWPDPSLPGLTPN